MSALSVPDQITVLAAQHKAGILTDAEFTAAKAKVTNPHDPLAGGMAATYAATAQRQHEYKINPFAARWDFLGSELDKLLARFKGDQLEKSQEAMKKQFVSKCKQNAFPPAEMVTLGALMFADEPTQLLMAELQCHSNQEALGLYNVHVLRTLMEKYPDHGYQRHQNAVVQAQYPLFPPSDEFATLNDELLACPETFATDTGPSGSGLIGQGSRKIPRVFLAGARPHVTGSAYWLPVQQTAEGPAVDIDEIRTAFFGLEDKVSSFSTYCESRFETLEKAMTTGSTPEAAAAGKKELASIRAKLAHLANGLRKTRNDAQVALRVGATLAASRRRGAPKN